MALIKCEECGQMVSDKASTCPHCGCPVKVPMVCPECGQTVDLGDSFCNHCGCSLNQVDNSDPQTSINQNLELGQIEIKEKSNNPLRWLLIVLATLIVIGCVSLFAWQRELFNKKLTQNDTTAVDSVAVDTLSDMAAPVIELNEDGMYTVENCPTTYEGLDILIEKDFNGCITKLDVKKGGKLVCSFSATGDSGFDVDNDQIHFLDANFDGYVDFFLGPVFDRSHSRLFLWDPSVSRFQVAMDYDQTTFNGIYHFHPAEQRVYTINTGGWSTTCVSRCFWIGNKLFTDEILYEQFLHSSYSEHQPNRYVIREGSYDGKILLSTDNPNKIPTRWKKWANIPTPEEEKKYAEADAQVFSAEESYRANDESKIEEIRSWIQGNWRYRMVSELGAMECRVGIDGDYIVVMYDGTMHYSGPYTIEGDNIIYNRHNGMSEGIMIDRTHKRLMATESEPMTRM